MLPKLIISIFLFLLSSPSFASECVYVKYRGSVPTKSMECNKITDSSFIHRVCYDESNEYMLINLNGIYYHYCSIPPSVVESLLGAGSKGRYYNGSIKGQYDCRIYPQPKYEDICN